MRPPRLAQRLVLRALDESLAEAVLGDLDEIFAAEARRAPARARLLYWRRAVGVVWHLAGRSTRRPLAATTRDSVMTSTLTDLLRGLRLFVTQPSFAWASVATLALAIGANTLIFTIANVLVVKPLPFHDEERLAWILASAPGSIPLRAGVSLPEYAAFRDDVPAFERLGAWRREAVVLRDGDRAERVVAHRVIGELLGVWGVPMAAGRSLTAADERPGAQRVAVLSHRAWSARFGAAPDAVGRAVVVDGQPHTIVGVLDPAIELGNMAEVDVWLPYAGDPALGPRDARGWRPVARIRPDVTLDEANAQVLATVGRIATAHPESSRDWTAHAGSTRDAMLGSRSWITLVLLALVVGLLLVLACANIMNLLIARLISRRHELAIRTALGATRARVVRQVAAESLLLGLAGGLAGLAIAWGGLKAIHAVAAEPFFRQLAFDVRVIAFATLLAFVAPLLFAILPTLRVLRDDARVGLSEGTTRTVGGEAAGRARSALVVLQVALGVTLLIVSSLVVQSMQAVVTADPGYDTASILSAAIDVPEWHVADTVAALARRQQVLTRVREIPGVRAATTTTTLPALQMAPVARVVVDGRAAEDPRDHVTAAVVSVAVDHERAFGLALIAGRPFTAADAASASPAVVVSAEAARRFWGSPHAAPGRHLQLDGLNEPAVVVGVLQDVANADLDPAPTPTVYVLDAHRPARATHLVVRADVPARLAATLRAVVASVDPDLPLSEVRTLDEAFADEHSSGRLLGGLFASFAGIAILLAMAGLYGVMSYAVSQRAPEIAVRMALGASRRAIAGQVVGQSVRLAGAGLAIGLVMAFGLANAVRSVLFGIGPSDLATYAGAAVLTFAAALLASWLPTWRAATIDPLLSLRRG